MEVSLEIFFFKFFPHPNIIIWAEGCWWIFQFNFLQFRRGSQYQMKSFDFISH